MASRFGTASLILLAALVIASASQNACSGTVAADKTPPSVCPQGQTAYATNGEVVCCPPSAYGSPSVCASPTGGSSESTGCGSAGATMVSSQLRLKLGTCVNDACNGDHTSSNFAETSELAQGTLVCTATQGALTWQWQAPPQVVHTVVRACVVTAPLSCSGSGYGYDGYGAGVPLSTRAPVVLSSTCPSATGTDACPVGNL